MKYKIGDKVIFVTSDKEYAWPLNNYEKYEITLSAQSPDHNDKTVYYAVKNKKNIESTWYMEDNFITIQEYRKLKLNKLKNKKSYGN